jgi:hypothetical protein
VASDAGPAAAGPRQTVCGIVNPAGRFKPAGAAATAGADAPRSEPRGPARRKPLSAEPRRPLWSFFAALFLAAFGLHWLWEMAQMPAYAEMAGRPWRETVVPCTLATLGDVAITLAVYGAGALAAGHPRWGATGRWNVYATAALLGGACAVAIEWKALASGRWSYTGSMPVVPVLGVGLWPLLQLTLLVPVALWLAGWWAGRR